MPKIFETTNRDHYFSRKADDAFFHNDFFFMKAKKVLPEHLEFCKGEKFLIGLVFSRKIGKAVLRNKIRRRIKMIFSDDSLKTEAFHAYIFIAKKQISVLSFKELKDLIEQTISKINDRLTGKRKINNNFSEEDFKAL